MTPLLRAIMNAEYAAARRYLLELKRRLAEVEKARRAAEEEAARLRALLEERDRKS
jgi:hypothetical protein